MTSKGKYSLKWYLFFTIVLISIKCNYAQTYLHVSLSGNDVTGTGTIASPYATVNKASTVATSLIATNPTVPVFILVRAGIYRNPGFTTNAVLDVNSYDPPNAGEPIWKQNANDFAVNISNVNGNQNAWITIKPYPNEQVIFEGDGDVCVRIRNSSYIRVEGFEIRGVLDLIPKQLAWKYWGTYRYLTNGNYSYGDRKQDICTLYNLSNCSDIPPNVLTTNFTYTGLTNINSLNVERPAIFQGKGLLAQLSHHIEILANEVHHFCGGGIRVTQSDFVTVSKNKVHHNSGRSSVGTHGLVIEGLTAQTADNSSNTKIMVSENLVYSNYNELYSWVQSKTIVTAVIDEGKGICILRTSPTESNYNGTIRVENNITYDNGKSGIHANDVDNLEIINNTVYNNAHTNIYDPAISGGINAGISIQSSKNIKIVNNIVLVQTGQNPELKPLSEGQNCSNLTVTKNIVFGSNNVDFGTNAYTITDPMFVDVAGNNVSLLVNSPAINAASTSYAPAKDYFGNTRTIPDIGAIEYLNTTGVNELKNNENTVLVSNLISNNTLIIDVGDECRSVIVATVVDAYGQYCFRFTLHRGSNNVNCNLANGIYFIEMNNTVRKMVVVSAQ